MHGDSFEKDTQICTLQKREELQLERRCKKSESWYRHEEMYQQVPTVWPLQHCRGSRSLTTTSCKPHVPGFVVTHSQRLGTMSSFDLIEHFVPCSYVRDFPGAVVGDDSDHLRLAVKQYIPRDNPIPQLGDVTIIGAHANGFPKELYEPLFEDLISQSSKYNFRIRSIWIADMAHQGLSSVENEHLLGNDPSWFDHSRDLMHLVNLKRDEMPRPIVGIGHSCGGAQLVHMSLWNPRLFSTLILIDPVIQHRSAEISAEDTKPNLAQLSTFRRELWPSRKEAAESFARSKFYQAWDPRVLDRWVQYGLRDLPTLLHAEEQPAGKPPKVTLTSTVGNEVHTYLRPNFEGYGAHSGKAVNRVTHPDLDQNRKGTYPFYRSEPQKTFERLPEVRPSVLYIFGGKSDTSGAATNEAKLAATGVGAGGSGGRELGRVKGITFDEAGHLIAMEFAERTAVACAEWLSGDSGELARWKKEDAEWRAAWEKLSLREKQVPNEQFKAMLGGDPRKKAKSRI